MTGGWWTARRSRSTPRRIAAASRSTPVAASPPWYQSGSDAFSWSCSAVAISPGKTVVTETPEPLSSCRSASAKPRWAALVAP